MAVPEAVIELIERFERNREAYTSGQYNEAQVRREFIDPFFEQLGWDVYNRQGYAEAYKDVIHEDAIKVGGATKAPDYCFRIGGTRKFFLEAKKPSVRLKDDTSAAYQLRRYAWSAKLPLSVLTDFEEFATYDCRIKPVKTDSPSTARTLYVSYSEYPERWDEIAAIFSRDAVLKGSFDKYVESSRAKRGTAEVDAAFLREIESWRETLARNIALRNPGLGQRELNFAVQRTIDRIIFLRICEDRGCEQYGQLMALQNGARVYERLRELFRRADQRYNSGLFHFEQEKGRLEPPDALTLGLSIDDRVLKDMIKNLYYPDSPYEFSVLPPDILGQVYEQFLGKLIRLTPGHRAVVEDKPEVKKAGGVYYTPTYIVDYIVKHTVGKLLEGRTPRQAAKLRILDPACGSGSFLIGAYQYLLDWHRDWYVTDGPAKHRKALYQGPGGDWRLATSERKRILLNNIYGVDIDPQAVEVTKLSLLLKVLEQESAETIDNVLKLFHQRALPDLGANIKCGNSLIGPDFYEGEQMTLLDEDERYRINVFDWEAEFPQIMKSGGFDAVIGNPPWGGDIDRELAYFHARYPDSTQDHTDSFKLFIDAAVALARDCGVVSVIVPSVLLRQRRLMDVRRLLLGFRIHRLADLGEYVFERVVAPSCILVVEKTPPSAGWRCHTLSLKGLSSEERAARLREDAGCASAIEQAEFSRNPDRAFHLAVRPGNALTVPLGNLDEVECRDAGINYQRVKVGMREKGRSDLGARLLYEGAREDPGDRMYWKGADIRRYTVSDTTDRFCRTNYKPLLRRGEVVRLNTEVYSTVPKILFRQTADRIVATLDSRGLWFGRSIIAVVPKSRPRHDLRYLLGLMNSKLLDRVYQDLAQESGRAFAQVKLSKVKQLPIRPINFSDPADKSRHDKMVKLVERMLALHKQLADAKTPHDKDVLQRQINATDRQIDSLVYELYGLTEEEIAIVEESAPPARRGTSSALEMHKERDIA